MWFCAIRLPKADLNTFWCVPKKHIWAGILDVAKDFVGPLNLVTYNECQGKLQCGETSLQILYPWPWTWWNRALGQRRLTKNKQPKTWKGTQAFASQVSFPVITVVQYNNSIAAAWCSIQQPTSSPWTGLVIWTILTVFSGFHPACDHCRQSLADKARGCFANRWLQHTFATWQCEQHVNTYLCIE